MRIAQVGLTVLGQRVMKSHCAATARASAVATATKIAVIACAITFASRLGRALGWTRIRYLGIAHTLDVEMPVIPVDVSGRSPELFT